MRTRSFVVGALAVLTIGLATPVAAAPPERSDVPLYQLFPDTKYGLAVFANITRAAYCAWEAGGFVGPPPVGELVPAKVVETPGGVLIGSFHADVSIELWRFDTDVPPLVGPCQDTDGQARPWATGTAHVVGNDNDLEATLTRTNSFGDRGQATVHDASGAEWHYSWRFRALISKDDVFSVAVESSTLAKKGK